MRLSRSIRNRFVVATVALVAVGIGALLALSFYLGGESRAALRDATLESELEQAAESLANDPGARLSQSKTLRIRRADSPDLPREFLELSPGTHPMVVVGERLYHVMVRETPRGYLYASFDVTEREQLEATDRWVITLCAAAFVVVIALCSVWLARSMLSPIDELAARLEEISPEDRKVRLGTKFGGTELAPIANSIDGFLSRLDGFVEREQSFTEFASHELRSPLAVLQGATELLAENAREQPALARAIERIRRATRDMSDFTQTLLMLAREPHSITNPGEQCDATEIANRVIEEQLSLVAGKAVTMHCECSAPVQVSAPASLVKIVLSNLVRNAILATEAGPISCRAHGRTIELRDSGRGIPEAAMGRVFDRNFSLRPGGHGLGLHVTKRICDHFGWSLGLESTATGTVARVTF
jgi:signal transduction histidine kinase